MMKGALADKVLFMEEGDNVILMNSNRMALDEYQRGMRGAAEAAGISTEQDAVDLVNVVRQEMWEKQHESDA